MNEIIPEIRVEDIINQSDEIDLIRLFGKENITHANISLGEGNVVSGTILFSNDINKKVEITWQDPHLKRFPKVVQFHGKKSFWKFPFGISLGTTLKELEKINGRPFTLYGFGWDYGGWIQSWQQGELEKEFKSGETVTVAIQLGVDFSNKDICQGDYAKICGDGTISSRNKTIQRFNPRVCSIRIIFDKNSESKICLNDIQSKRASIHLRKPTNKHNNWFTKIKAMFWQLLYFGKKLQRKHGKLYKHILIIYHEPNLSETIKDRLAMQPFSKVHLQITTLNPKQYGNKCCNLLKFLKKADVVILAHYHMPEPYDGDYIRNLISKYSESAVILLTGHPEFSAELKNNFTEWNFIEKPFELIELLEILEKNLFNNER